MEEAFVQTGSARPCTEAEMRFPDSPHGHCRIERQRTWRWAALPERRNPRRPGVAARRGQSCDGPSHAGSIAMGRADGLNGDANKIVGRLLENIGLTTLLPAHATGAMNPSCSLFNLPLALAFVR